MQIKKLEELLEVKYDSKMKLVVVASHDREVLHAVSDARKLGIVDPILIGDEKKTIDIINKYGYKLSDCEIINETDLVKASTIGVKMVNDHKANFIMKGLVDTSILLKEVLNREYGLRTDSLLSHVMIYEIPSYHKLVYLTDGGMNLYPSLTDKVNIINNCFKVCKSLGSVEMKVACLAAKEKVNPKMEATVHGNELKKMYLEGKFEEGVVVDGPLALDLAISKEAAKIKGFESTVAGDADVLLVPTIEMGNGIGKSITYFAGGKSAGVVMGAKAPIVLVSRADDHQAKLYSIALGSIVANKNN